MNIASAITFDTAEREYNEAWGAPSSTRFELRPVDVNKVLKARYRVTPEQTLTRAMIWDMETKKAWDPLTYIPMWFRRHARGAEPPYATAPRGSAGRRCSADGSRWRKDASSRMFSSAMPSRPSISSDAGRLLKKAARLSWRARSNPSFMSDML
jgi:hypothetical protein